MRKKTTKGKFLKIFIMFLFVIVCIGIAGWTYMYSYLCSFTNKNTVSSGDKVKAKEVKMTEPVNILVMGTDIGDPKADPNNNRQRTDTMMVAHYNPKDESLNIVSVPRDTKVKVNGKTAKINSANEVGGAEKAIDTVESLLDIEVNYYVRIDYRGFNELVDAIGGIEMPINYTMKYDDPAQNLHINFQRGTVVHLDGKKAEEFFRWRKNNAGVGGGLPTGDIGRIDNQHIFIEKVIEKIKSVSIITKIPNILKVAQKNIYTNMNGNEILDYGLTFAKLSKEKIKMTTLQGDTPTIDGVSYFVYDSKKNTEILSILRDQGDGARLSDVDDDKKNSNDEEAESKGKDLKVQILNGTKRNGIASNYKNYLSKKGYKNIVAGNGKAASVSQIIVNNMNTEDVSKIKKDFEISNVKYSKGSSNSYDVIVVLGEDYESKN